ncbi:MAG: hypothetical protein Q8P20_10365 [bacterium]|nr:hypothetical protein [bacterium]
MKVQKSLSSPLPFVVAVIASGLLVPLIGYLSILVFPIFYAIAYHGISKDMDGRHEANSRSIISQAKRTGNHSITVSQKETSRDQGALIGLPMNRKYKAKF